MEKQDWQALWDASVGNIHTMNYTFYREAAEALNPLADILGPPTVQNSCVAEDSYGGGMFPPTYGVLVSWNMAEQLHSWRGLEDLVPLDPAKPAIGVLIGNYHSSCCVARVAPHPLWRITFPVFNTPRYHTMPQFVTRCLETLAARPPRPECA